tara:strand:+ start:908 stop:1369 length:462 start_codon:yes stop_codon:yes gene_type:complete
MNEPVQKRPLARMGLIVMLPLAAILAIIVWLSEGSTGGSFTRFANALLTSFTLFSFMLLLTLFVYGDARKRPIAPLLGMCMSVLLGIGLTVFFLSQGELLMEDNGSVRAQALSNTIRFGTTMLGVALGAVVVGGTLFASIMNGPSQTIHFEEE